MLFSMEATCFAGFGKFLTFLFSKLALLKMLGLVMCRVLFHVMSQGVRAWCSAAALVSLFFTLPSVSCSAYFFIWIY